MSDLINDEDIKANRSLEIKYTYPDSDKYEFTTEVEAIDLDREAQIDIESGDGFVITKPKSSMKKDLKEINGIYSSRFGQRLGDVNTFIDRYSCECGHLKGRFNQTIECPICHTKCKFVDDNFDMFGWIILKDQYHILHPKFYDELDFLFGQSPYNTERKKIKGRKLTNMLNYSPEVDMNGKTRDCEFKPAKEPFYGIGLMAFYERFDEILDYYYLKNPKKKDYYDDIKAHKDIVFIHSIPVFTTHLRPQKISDNQMYYEKTNEYYNMITRHVHSINKDRRRMDQDAKIKNSELYKVQENYMKLVEEIFNILNGKKGQLRMLISGRYNFSCRAVIRQGSDLRIDQVRLPYKELVKCLELQIKNILIRTYNIGPAEAHKIWSNALAEKDPRVGEIIDAIIHSYPEGIPIIINRNPTINYGSILQVFCIGYTDTLTMSISLQVLKLLCADFDGDVLNIFHIINDKFFERCYTVFNPRNAFYISRINGKTNDDVLPYKDTLINANTLIYLGRNNYSRTELDNIRRIKEKQKKYFDEAPL